jgi:hypothetical protein
MAQPPNSGHEEQPVERSGTVVETDDDIRQALLSGLKGQQQDVPVEPKLSYPPTPNAGRPASPFRPTIRRFDVDGEPAGRVAESLGHSENAAILAKSRVLKRLMAKCHHLPIGFVPPPPDQSGISWTEKPHPIPKVAMSKVIRKPPAAEPSFRPSEVADRSTRSPRSST